MPLGIPDRSDYGDLSKLSPGELVSWIVQSHNADRAKLHSDVRFGRPDTGLYSWAVRKGMPTPGNKHLAVQQPIHDSSYANFEGEIPKGQYGAGTVTKADEGQVLITKVNPDAIHFSLAHKKYPERYILLRPKQEDPKKWLLMNVTPTQAIPHEKVRYAKVDTNEVDDLLKTLQPGSSVQAKIDGSASIAKLMKDKMEVVSYRPSKVHGGAILHSERLFGTLPKLNVPKDLIGTQLRGELYGMQNNKAIPPQQLGGLLNSSVAKSLTNQKAQGIDLRNLIFDIEQRGKNKIDLNTPYAERRQHITDILSKLRAANPPEVLKNFENAGYSTNAMDSLNKLHTPEVTGEATNPQDAANLWQNIQQGKNPHSSEGIVIHPPTGKPIKSKFVEDHDVYLRKFFPGKGKYKDNGVGGFVYSHEPEGDIAGEVGTGFDDATRAHMHTNPEEYLGKIMRVKAQEKLPSGALRAPVFLGAHLG